MFTVKTKLAATMSVENTHTYLATIVWRLVTKQTESLHITDYLYLLNYSVSW